MSRTVVFEGLWLLSERDKSARHLTFHPSRNLLAGENGMGKSRVLKHLVWVLGAEPPKRAAGDFDSNVVAFTRVSVGSKKRTFLRQNRQRSAFDADGKLLFATSSASKWSAFFAEEFDFPLKLQRHEDDGFDYAGPSYALLPFYIDQDGGWSLKWSGFTNLTQFAATWQKTVFNAFTGLKPVAYVENQLKRDEAAHRLRLAKAQAKVQQSSYERVVAMLPPESTVINEADFAVQLRDIGLQVQQLQTEQDDARADMMRLAQERQQKWSELQTVFASEKSLVEDLAYLAKYKDEERLVCPTCSHVHVASFSARETLAVDAHEIHKVGVKLQGELDKFKSEEARLQKTLTSVAERLRNLKRSFDREQGGQRVADVIAAKSRQTLLNAYTVASNDLSADIDSLSEEKRTLDEELAALTDKGRERRVRQFFKEELISVADRLDIDKAEIGSKVAIGARPSSASGSYLPRAVLATHMALLSANRQHGVGCVFPFIVDTPQQSGQDPVSLGRMLDEILVGAGEGQRMVATEAIPKGWSAPEGCKVLLFEEKRSLLREGEFLEGIEAVRGMIQAMREALLTELTADESEPGEVASSQAGDDDDDDGFTLEFQS